MIKKINCLTALVITLFCGIISAVGSIVSSQSMRVMEKWPARQNYNFQNSASTGALKSKNTCNCQLLFLKQSFEMMNKNMTEFLFMDGIKI